MRRSIVPTLALCLGLLAVLGLGACSDDAEDDARDVAEDVREEGEDAVTSVSEAADDATDDAAEAAVRNLAATHGADEFEDAGHEIDGDLECEASITDGEDAVDVTCTGTTVDGEEAELTGTTSEIPGTSVTELEGEFTGTVAGDEVFSVQDLGD